jgi:hypothetical protein
MDLHVGHTVEMQFNVRNVPDLPVAVQHDYSWVIGDTELVQKPLDILPSPQHVAPFSLSGVYYLRSGGTEPEFLDKLHFPYLLPESCQEQTARDAESSTVSTPSGWMPRVAGT